MRVVYLHANTVPSDQANMVQVFRMASAMAKEGHAVTLILPRSGRAIDADSLRVRYGTSDDFAIRLVPAYSIFRVRLLRMVLEALRTSRFEPCCIYYTRSAAVAVVLGMLRRRLVLELHAPLAVLSNRVRQRLLGAVSAGRIRRLVLISSALAGMLVDEFNAAGMVAPEMVVAHDAGDSFTSPAPSPFEGAQKPRIGYAGHLYAGRGVEIIFELAQRLPEYDFHLLGGKEPELSAWRERAGALSNLRFLGAVPPTEVGAFLAGCAVLLAPYQEAVFTADQGLETSRWMSPLKVFEYMAAERPLICSDLPVLREVLRHGDNALLCKPDDIDAWAIALQRLTSDNILANRLATTARHEAQTLYSWRGRARRVLSGLNDSTCREH